MPLIPGAQHHIREGDLLDATPFTVRHDDVIHPDRVAEGELHAREHGGEGRLGGETGDDSGDPGRRQQARTDGLYFGEGQQD